MLTIWVVGKAQAGPEVTAATSRVEPVIKDTLNRGHFL